MSALRTGIMFSCALFFCVPAASLAQSWRSRQIEASRKSEKIMHEADKHKGLLAQYQVMRRRYR